MYNFCIITYIYIFILGGFPILGDTPRPAIGVAPKNLHLHGATAEAIESSQDLSRALVTRIAAAKAMGEIIVKSSYPLVK
jgi:hypothetical protein